jgi:Flp pilus assembly protein TadG
MSANGLPNAAHAPVPTADGARDFRMSAQRSVRRLGSGRMRVPSQTSPRSARERGQSLVEFTLILPILLMLLLGIADFARLFNTMISVESAAREAADYGTLYPWQWSPGNSAITVEGMQQRACAATAHLPEYVGDGTTCTNPSFKWELDNSPAGVPANQCHSVARSSTPCNVVVTLTYKFDLIAPTGIIGVPPSITFSRSAVFAVSDFEIDNQ